MSPQSSTLYGVKYLRIHFNPTVTEEDTNDM